jgi:DNA primase
MSRHQLHRVKADLIRLGLGDFIDVAMLVYLACISRFLGRPFSVVLDGPSSLGKSTILSTVLRLMPESAIKEFSLMTRAGLLRQGVRLKGKVLVIHESIDDPDILAPLRQLSSEGKVTYAYASPTGPMEVTLQGPTPVIETTTNSQAIDFQNRSRSLVVVMQPSPEILNARFAAIKKKWAGRPDQSDLEVQSIRESHEEMQRNFDPSLKVLIPFAERVGFRSTYPHAQRLLDSFFSLTGAIAFVDQHGRTRLTCQKTGAKYIEATIEDYAEARRLVTQAPIDTGTDLMPEQSAHLFEELRRIGFSTTKPFTRLQITLRCPALTSKYVRTWIEPLVEGDLLAVRTGFKNRREYVLTETGDKLPASMLSQNCFGTLSAPEKLLA